MNEPETCRVCHGPVRVNIRRGTGLCSGICADRDLARKQREKLDEK